MGEIVKIIGKDGEISYQEDGKPLAYCEEELFIPWLLFQEQMNSLIELLRASYQDKEIGGIVSLIDELHQNFNRKMHIVYNYTFDFISYIHIHIIEEENDFRILGHNIEPALKSPEHDAWLKAKYPDMPRTGPAEELSERAKALEKRLEALEAAAAAKGEPR